jgi:2'-5' RNA ligase
VPSVDLGIAIGLPDPVGAALQAWRLRLGDVNVHRIPPHVTLLAPTRVDVTAWDAVVEHLDAIGARERPFTLELRGTGTFRPRSPVVFVAVAGGTAQCARLERLVRHGPLARSATFPFHPHVTVAHEIDEASLDQAQRELAGYSADVPVEAITVYEKDRDKVWRPKREIPLLGR